MQTVNFFAKCRTNLSLVLHLTVKKGGYFPTLKPGLLLNIKVLPKKGRTNFTKKAFIFIQATKKTLAAL